MAKTSNTTATFTLSSADLTSSSLNVIASTTLTKAASKLGLTDTSGLGVKTTTSVDQYTLFYADQYTADKSSKVYLKNLSTIASEFFLVSIDDEPLGRLYAGDFSFFPWAATNGTKAAFTITLTNTWATGDTLTFDGVTMTNGATETGTGFIDIIKLLKFPNWTVAETAATVCTFTAKNSNYLGLIEESTASDDWVKSSSSGVNTVARTVAAVASANDIKITPSVATSMSLEHILINE